MNDEEPDEQPNDFDPQHLEPKTCTLADLRRSQERFQADEAIKQAREEPGSLTRATRRVKEQAMFLEDEKQQEDD